MAGTSLQPGACRANADVTRRGMIATMMAATAMSVPAAHASAAFKAPLLGREPWDQAFARMTQLKRVSDDASERYANVNKRYEALRLDPDSVDLREFKFQHRLHVLNKLDLDDYQRSVVDGRGIVWWGDDRALQRRLDAIDAVRKWRAADQRACDATGIDQLGDHCDEACDAYVDALDVLVEMPAPDLPALLWKLEYLMAAEADEGRSTPSWSPEYVSQTIADMRRLLSAEA